MAKILFFASECKPFSQAGGVGDVAGQLPLYLKKQSGHEIKVVTPLYRQISAERVGARLYAPWTLPFHGADEPYA